MLAHSYFRRVKTPFNLLTASLLLTIGLMGCGNEAKSVDYSEIPPEERHEFQYYKVGEDWYKFPGYSKSRRGNLKAYIGASADSIARDPRRLVWETPHSRIRGRVSPHDDFFPDSERHDLYRAIWNTFVAYDV